MKTSQVDAQALRKALWPDLQTPWKTSRKNDKALDIVKIKLKPKHTTANTLIWVNGSITGKQLTGGAEVIARVSLCQHLESLYYQSLIYSEESLVSQNILKYTVFCISAPMLSEWT